MTCRSTSDSGSSRGIFVAFVIGEPHSTAVPTLACATPYQRLWFPQQGNTVSLTDPAGYHQIITSYEYCPRRSIKYAIALVLLLSLLALAK
jgi:hypothetical protein